MMNLSKLTDFEYLVAGDYLLAAILLFATAVLALLRYRRALRTTVQQRDRALALLAASAGQETPAPDAALIGFLDHRMRLLEGRLREQLGAARVPEGKPQPTPEQKSGSLPFDYAVRMARQGAGVDELIRACGLNRAEARLIRRLHGGHAEEDVTRH